MWKTTALYLVLVWIMSLAPGCSDSPSMLKEEESGPLVVYTVNYPLAYFAERIGGEAVEVHFPAPPDEDPAYWEPAPTILRTIAGVFTVAM